MFQGSAHMEGQSDEVFTVSLDELSSIVGVAQEDLVAALKHEDSVDVAGTLVDSNVLAYDELSAFKGFLVGMDQLIVHEAATDTLLSEESSLLVAKPRYGSAKTRLRNAVRAIGRFKVFAKHKVERRHNTCIEKLRPEFTISIPAPKQVVHPLTPRPSRPRTHAFMIPMQSHAASHSQYVLAVEDPWHRRGSGALLRSLSSLTTLPSELSRVTLETVHDATSDEVAVQVVVTKRVPLAGYVLLTSALLTISSLGAALDLQSGVDPFVKLFWRTTASIIGFLPFAGYSIIERGWPSWNRQLVKLFAVCSFSYALFLMTFLWSLNHTSIGHAYIFNNCHSLLIVMGKFLLGSHVLFYEVVGSALGLVGGVVTTLDHTGPNPSDISAAVSPSWQGDVVALIGAIGGVFYLLTAKKLRQEMDVFVFMTLLFVMTALLHIPVFYALNIDIELSLDHHVGWFGWTQPDMLPVELYLVFVCTIVGTVGYISAMKYFDPIVVSVVMLLEPILATAIGVVFGVDTIPGILTWVGGLLVLAGTGLVVMAGSNKIESHDVTDAIHKAPPSPSMYSYKLTKKHKHF
ncbi:hypothetical protein AeRB84_015632 [Aphanomyces euteiches]|nr:hypothetical protein AeRB84_015632 [Aphanomyces euteiches]